MRPVNTQDQLAQAEATFGRLPSGARIIVSARDFQLIEIQLSSDKPAMVQRVCVLYPGASRDLRVLWVLGALAILERDTCSKLVALAADRGKLRSWWASPTPMLIGMDIQRLAEAADAALAPDDKWSVLPPTLVMITPSGTADLDALPEDDDLRRMPMRSYTLGRVAS